MEKIELAQGPGVVTLNELVACEPVKTEIQTQVQGNFARTTIQSDLVYTKVLFSSEDGRFKEGDSVGFPQSACKQQWAINPVTIKDTKVILVPRSVLCFRIKSGS